MPERAPAVEHTETWREHRPLYESLFERPDTFLFLASTDGDLVGYALGCVMPAAEGWAADTWRVGDRIGELESLSVLPDHRGEGVGSLLLDAVDEEFAKLGVGDVVIGALPGNTGALKLYERRGFKPTWIYLSRFAARGEG